MMTKSTIPGMILCLGLLIGSNSEGQTEKNAGNYMLWSVKSATNTVYLLGSIHVMKKEFYPLPMEYEYVYRHCPNIAFETKLDDRSMAEARADAYISATYPDGEDLPGNISKETMKLLQQTLTQCHIPLMRVKQLKPWYIAISLESAVMESLGFHFDDGIDRYFLRKALYDDKKLHFLESLKFQMDLLATLSPAEQDHYLLGSLKEFGQMETGALITYKAWKSANLTVLGNLGTQFKYESPALYDRIVVQRNKNWIPKLKTLLSDKENILVIVGCGHLVGKNSVIDLLRKEGFTVKQH